MGPTLERRRPLVLVVDDDRSERFLLSSALEREGFTVEAAASGPEAISLFSSIRPDIVLLDVDMPRMNGIEICRAIREMLGGRKVPVLMVTGQTDETSIDLSFEAGATDFISKPLNWVILSRRVRYLLRAARVFRENDALLRALPDAIYRIDAEGMVLDTNQEGERATIFDMPSPVGRRLQELLPEKTAQLVLEAARLACRERRTQGLDLRLTERENADFEVRLEPLEKGEVLAIVRDMGQHKRNQRLTARLARVLDHSSSEIYIFEARGFAIVQVNWRAREHSGYSQEELTHKEIFQVMPGVNRDQFLRLAEPLWSGARDTVVFEAKNRRKNGQVYPVEVTLHLSSEEVPPVYVAVVQDITERQKANERIRYLAYYDPLTNLPNRTLFCENLRYLLRLANRQNHQVALLFIDIDRFKQINDTLGHSVGDLLLRTLADRLSTCLRDSDVLLPPSENDAAVNLARLGGDEFIVVLSNFSQDCDPARVARRIMGVISQPCHLNGHEVIVTPSIGIAVYPRDGSDLEALLKHADIAMYNAKHKGKNNFQFYQNSMNEKALDRLQLEGSLRKAVEHGELVLYYQPLVDPLEGRIVGLEALVRWNHPERGLVPPSEFIPLAEETGLILSIGEWVLETACLQARAWADQGLHQIIVSVNISGQQFTQPQFPEIVDAIIRRTQVDPAMMGLEVTESTIMGNAPENVNTLHVLKRMGLKLSVDDFGTGYSSLSYLKCFPIDYLKIDRSFVKDVTNSQDDARIVQAIMNLARGLNMGVVAEGVETREQLAVFQAETGSVFVQGFLFDKPLPVALATQSLGRSPYLSRPFLSA